MGFVPRHPWMKALETNPKTDPSSRRACITTRSLDEPSASSSAASSTASWPNTSASFLGVNKEAVA